MTSSKTIQCVSVPTLTLFGPMTTELWIEESGECSVVIYGNGLVGMFLPTNMATAI